MNKILLALDCSPHSLRAAAYVAAVAGRCAGVEIALLTVMKGIPYGPEVMEELLAGAGSSPELHGDEDPQLELNQARTFAARVAGNLEGAGVPPSRVSTSFKTLARGVALDIVDEARSSGCDTVVVGRQSHSRFEELLAGSVSTELVRHGEGLTVWVVA